MLIERLFAKLWMKLTNNPLHVVIALYLAGAGYTLLQTPHYFIWPPYVDAWADDHGFDAVFIFLAASFVAWIFSKRQDEEWDAINLGAAAFLMLILTIYEFVHFMHTGIPMPFVEHAATTLMIYILARRSDANAA